MAERNFFLLLGTKPNFHSPETATLLTEPSRHNEIYSETLNGTDLESHILATESIKVKFLNMCARIKILNAINF
jgi:hypothetical protein